MFHNDVTIIVGSNIAQGEWFKNRPQRIPQIKIKKKTKSQKNTARINGGVVYTSYIISDSCFFLNVLLLIISISCYLRDERRGRMWGGEIICSTVVFSAKYKSISSVHVINR